MAGELQHYVPRFLLKNFATGKKPQVFVYDKSNDRQFKTNIKNIAAETGFYDIEVGDGRLTLEPKLGHLETNASSVIKKIVGTKSLQNLDEQDVAVLAVFLAVQFVRTKEHRLRFEHVGELLRERLSAMGATEENIAELTESQHGVPEDKMIGFQSIIKSDEFVPHFLNKQWALFETTIDNPFYISDSPITLHNELDHGLYGNIGLGVKGIEIYFPLSSTLSLGLLCPSIGEEFQKGYDNIKFLDKNLPGMADAIMKKSKTARAFCEGLRNGTAIQLVKDNVTMMNSLQVMYSSRFVYCEDDGFNLIKQMISDNDKFRTGLKPVAS